MKFALTVSTVAALAATALAQGLTINSLTNVVQCQPILLSWSGGAPPYWVTLVDGNNPNGAGSIIKELVTSSNDQSYTWLVDVPLAKYDLQIRDSTGATNNNAPFDVIAGSSSSCLNASSSGSASSTESGSASTSASASASASASSAASSAVSSASSAASSAVSSASSVASSASSAASSAASTSKASTRTSSSSTGTSSAPASSQSGNGNSAATLTGAGFAGFVGAAAAFFLA